MNEKELAGRVASTFERLQIPYFITGSMASIAQGEPRYTNDIDVVADVPVSGVASLLEAFPAPEFRLSESAIREAIAHRHRFNLIHISTGLKVDVIIPEESEFNHLRMRRKVRLNLGAEQSGWFASPEDLILKKLLYFQEGGSDEHLRDIAGVLLIQDDKIDRDYLDQWAAKLGVTRELELVRDKLREGPT